MINLVYITDNNYVRATLASINSALRHNRNINIYVVCDNVSDKNIKLLARLGAKTIVADNMLKNTKQSTYVSTAALIKFELPNLFPNLDKILYIDGDTLVLDNLSEIYDINLRNKYAAVVCDAVAIIKNKEHERLGFAKYFNSGVMLLNLKKMRVENMPHNMQYIKLNQPELHYMDQDVFNVAFNENVIWLGFRYNMMTVSTEMYSPDVLSQLFETTKSDIKKNISHPVILHLAGSEKPWNTRWSKFYSLWSKYEFPRTGIFIRLARTVGLPRLWRHIKKGFKIKS